MIYVIQVISRTEDKMIDIIKKSITDSYLIDIFSPTKEKLIKVKKT